MPSMLMPATLAALEAFRTSLSTFAGSILPRLFWVIACKAFISSPIGASVRPFSPNMSFMADTAADMPLSLSVILFDSNSCILLSKSGRFANSAAVSLGPANLFLSIAAFC